MYENKCILRGKDFWPTTFHIKPNDSVSIWIPASVHFLPALGYAVNLFIKQ